MNADERREIEKALDVFRTVHEHFAHEAKMNAALHMAREVRPAPLAVAVDGAVKALERLSEQSVEDSVHESEEWARRDPHRATWTCTITGPYVPLAMGADAPMRRAVEAAFREVVGFDATACWSGWNGAARAEAEHA